MKKVTLISTAAVIAVLSCGCGNTVSKDSIIVATTSPTEVTSERDFAEELPTIRERNIVTSDIFDYEVYDGGVIITKYKGNDSSVEVPAEIEGTPVTEIGFYAFEAKSSLVSVALPESIKTIGEGAFLDCTALADINLPAGLTDIQRGAFVSCTALSELTIPAGVQHIEEEVFTACDGLTSLTVLSPDLQYENWGLESLPYITVYAPDGTAAAQWASEMGIYAVY